MLTRVAIAELVYSMVNAVLFGAGLITVMAVPALSAHAITLLPTVVVVSLVLAIPLLGSRPALARPVLASAHRTGLVLKGERDRTKIPQTRAGGMQ